MAAQDATSTTWFTLTRHDEATEPAEADSTEAAAEANAGDDDDSEAEQLLADAVDGDEDDDEDPEGAEQLGDPGKRALEAMKQRLKTERQKARDQVAAVKKQLAQQAAKLAEYEDADKSEKEKLAGKAERAEQQVAGLRTQLVQAEVKVLATSDFADPSDAQAFLGDLSRYIGDDGAVDTEQIRSDLSDLLDAKPHLRRPEPVPAGEPKKPAKPKPKPDPGQGGRGEKPIDFRTAPQEQVDAELAKYGVHRYR